MNPEVVDVAIVGSGFSGLGMAIQLQREARRSFVVLEQADEVGGTWRANHYPGCACDVPSALYSFSFAPNPGWTRTFAPQREILDYLRGLVDRYQLRPHLRLGTRVRAAVFDEQDGLWRLETSGGVVVARHVVLGIGGLSQPSTPSLPGLGDFAGTVFHSAEWRHDVPLDGKRVAVIGTGASAIQIVPQIVPRVGHLDLYQRTPPWVLPKPDHAISPTRRKLYAMVPFAQKLERARIYWTWEARGLGFTVDPRIMKLAARMGRAHLARQVADPALRARLTPSYMPGCKRILMADDYYPAITQPHVDVVTDGIRRVTTTGIETVDGHVRDVDAILFATGFRISDFLAPVRVVGRAGRVLNEEWHAGGVAAYMGVTVSGYPNLYLMMGPNTGLGHNSMVFMIEAQIEYARACMRAVEAHGARWADVKPRAQDGYNDAIQPRLQKTVWASGCQSWYLGKDGKNETLWPGFTFEYWWRTRRVDQAAYEYVGIA